MTWREQKLRRRVRALTGYAQVLLAHGQFVEEAEDILEMGIRDAQVRGQTHLHVIVGRRNHCHCHVQKIKPHVEEVCRLLGLDFATEASEGRIYVDLTGGKVGTAPPLPQQPNGYQGGYASGGGGGGGGGYNHNPNAGYPASGWPSATTITSTTATAPKRCREAASGLCALLCGHVRRSHEQSEFCPRIDFLFPPN